MAGASRAAFEMGEAVVRAGRRAKFALPLFRLHTGTRLSLPVCVLHGREPGPTLWLSAAIHGDEVNGVAVIQRVLARLDAPRLAGTLIAVPVVNVFGFVQETRYLPDGRDLNRSFPGSARGSLAGRLAHVFMREIVARCDYGIDLHTGSSHRTNLPHVRADLDHEPTLRVARAFAAPVLLHAGLRDGSLREAAKRSGIPTLLFEGGEALRLDEPAIDVGVSGVLGVMQSLGMIADQPQGAGSPPFEARGSRWLRASRSGLLELEVDLGQRVAPRQLVGRILDTFGETVARLRSPLEGVVIGRTVNPLVHAGEAVAHLAHA